MQAGPPSRIQVCSTRLRRPARPRCFNAESSTGITRPSRATASAEAGPTASATHPK